VIVVPAIPRNHTGKKLELPVKRILQGTPREQVASADALARPGSLDPFIALVTEYAGRPAAAVAP
jgi:acetoacetyl-CoA synthetase